MRRAALGFVYQFHHLLPEFSALENVMLPQMIAGRSRGEARVRAMELLGLVGLAACNNSLTRLPLVKASVASAVAYNTPRYSASGSNNRAPVDMA